MPSHVIVTYMSDVVKEVEVLAPLPGDRDVEKRSLPWLKKHQFGKNNQPAKVRQKEQNAKRLHKALMKELTPAMATRLIRNLFQEALDGNMKAYEQIWDRAEGKAVQVNENRGSGELTIRIERVG